MKLLGIDYGSKKIGLAKSDGSLALPLGVIKDKSRIAAITEIKELCQREGIEKIIVGIPLSLATDGQAAHIRPEDYANQQMQTVLQFIEALRVEVTQEVIPEDERMSTKMAQRMQKDLTKKNGDDAVAAMLILQSYLDRQK